MLKASSWLKALKHFRPDIASATEAAWAGKTVDSHADSALVRPDATTFASIPSQSIDYAVMEHCPGSQFPITMLALDAGWSDLGAWDAVWQVGEQDGQGNVVQGDALVADTIAQLAQAVSTAVGFQGNIDFDPTQPDGSPRKLMDSTRLNALGWQAKVNLEQGLTLAYNDFLTL